MFKEIETEIMSIISTDPIDKIAHIPTKNIAKTMDLIYNIKFENIEKVYTESIGNINRMVVVYKDSSIDEVAQDICPINGKVYHITMIPSKVLDTTENNAITLIKSIIGYTSIRLGLLSEEYNITEKVKDNTFDLVKLQSIPVITCAIARKIYSGITLPKLIYMTLIDTIENYNSISFGSIPENFRL